MSGPEQSVTALLERLAYQQAMQAWASLAGSHLGRTASDWRLSVSYTRRRLRALGVEA